MLHPSALPLVSTKINTRTKQKQETARLTAAIEAGASTGRDILKVELADLIDLGFDVEIVGLKFRRSISCLRPTTNGHHEPAEGDELSSALFPADGYPIGDL
jgi:hypothetical protein